MLLNRSKLDPRLQMSDTELSSAAINVVPEVARRNDASDSLGLAAGIAGALLLGGATLFMLSQGREAAQLPAPAPAVEAPVAPPAPVKRPPAPRPAPAPVIAPTPAPAPAPEVAAAEEPEVSPDNARAPALVVDMSAPTAAVGKASANQPGKADAAAKAANNGFSQDEQFAARMGSSDVQTTRATRLANQNAVVVQGTLIPAVLETALNSDLPGFARALVTQDVRSFDGSTVLVPRGSRVIGQYRGGLAVGQRRAFVMWTRLLRPDGVSIQLASPATDDLGRTGLSGDVDTHFFQRFGSAVLLSIVGGLSAVNGAPSVIIGSGSGGQDIASTALQRDANISPTVKVAQGEPIQIFTARDLDFSSVQGGVL